MPLDPIEILCIKLPEIATALKALVDSRMIRIVDILFIRKSDHGEATLLGTSHASA